MDEGKGNMREGKEKGELEEKERERKRNEVKEGSEMRWNVMKKESEG